MNKIILAAVSVMGLSLLAMEPPTQREAERTGTILRQVLPQVTKQLSSEVKTFVGLPQLQEATGPQGQKIFSLNYAKPTIKKMPPATGLPQTAAYMSVPVLNHQVQKAFGDLAVYGKPNYLQKYASIIADIEQKEKDFFDTHYVFYHARNVNLLVVFDVAQEIMKWLSVYPNQDFVGLRLPNSVYTINTSILEFIDAQMQAVKAEKGDVGMFDIETIKTGPIVQKLKAQGTINPEASVAQHLVSVNLSLYANSNPWSISMSECTMQFFASNKSLISVDSGEFLTELLKSVNIQNISLYSTQLQQAWSKFNSTCKPESGVLFQIFIPRDTVENYAYLSKAFGIYGTSKPVGWGGAAQPEPLADFLEKYRNAPHSIPPSTLDNMQARLVMTTDGFLNPASGIKIFEYMDVDKNCWDNYKQQVAVIVKEMMYEWYADAANKQIADSQATIKGLQTTLPLASGDAAKTIQSKIAEQQQSIAASKTLLALIARYKNTVKPIVKTVVAVPTDKKIPKSTKERPLKPYEKAAQNKKTLYALAESLAELRKLTVTKK